MLPPRAEEIMPHAVVGSRSASSTAVFQHSAEKYSRPAGATPAGRQPPPGGPSQSPPSVVFDGMPQRYGAEKERCQLQQRQQQQRQQHQHQHQHQNQQHALIDLIGGAPETAMLMMRTRSAEQEHC